MAKFALGIGAELVATYYNAAQDELAAIDEGIAGEAASEGEIEAAFALLRKA